MLQHESAARKRRNGIFLAAAYYDTKCQQIPDSAAAIVQSLQYRCQWSWERQSPIMVTVSGSGKHAHSSLSCMRALHQ